MKTNKTLTGKVMSQTNKEPKIPLNVSFSVKHDAIPVLEKFNELIEKGDLNKSAIFVSLMREYISNKNSNIEKMFDNYCAENHLSKDAQLLLLMGPYRVSNNGKDLDSEVDEEYDFFNRKETGIK